eukprot:186736_1
MNLSHLKCSDGSNSQLSKRKSLFSRTNIGAVHQNNKDLVLGYIKELLKSNIENIPQLINYLCLLFLNETKDEWEPKNTHHSITINKNDNSVIRKSCHGYKSAYLSNIISCGIHIWKFKFIQKGYNDCIGIHKENKKLTVSFDMCFRGKGYASSFSATLPVKIDPLFRKDIRTMFVYKQVNVEIIEMKVDLKRLTVSYSIDGGNYFKAFNIDKGKYRAGVTLSTKHSQASLLSYQHIY